MTDFIKTAGFCWNSRRWLAFMIMDLPAMKTCPLPPVGSQCDNCGYYKERKTTKHFQQKYGILKKFGELLGKQK